MLIRTFQVNTEKKEKMYFPQFFFIKFYLSLIVIMKYNAKTSFKYTFLNQEIHLTFASQKAAFWPRPAFLTAWTRRRTRATTSTPSCAEVSSTRQKFRNIPASTRPWEIFRRKTVTGFTSCWRCRRPRSRRLNSSSEIFTQVKEKNLFVFLLSKM